VEADPLGVPEEALEPELPGCAVPPAPIGVVVVGHVPEEAVEDVPVAAPDEAPVLDAPDFEVPDAPEVDDPPAGAVLEEVVVVVWGQVGGDAVNPCTGPKKATLKVEMPDGASNTTCATKGTAVLELFGPDSH
jgi:hypothetical protein